MTDIDFVTEGVLVGVIDIDGVLVTDTLGVLVGVTLFEGVLVTDILGVLVGVGDVVVHSISAVETVPPVLVPK